MKVKGILHGQTIELLEQINVPDGTEVTIEISDRPITASTEERLAKLNQLFGAWHDQSDLDDIFAEIDRNRHVARGRQLDSFED
ncbi:hypothetical protein LEP3755_31060 [Leptolyngbya sp. NIES-3755]|nr:hypothetical protein LEP3755_31060 [Leptolyngbya sp. NIES-3755]